MKEKFEEIFDYIKMGALTIIVTIFAIVFTIIIGKLIFVFIRELLPILWQFLVWWWWL